MAIILETKMVGVESVLEIKCDNCNANIERVFDGGIMKHPQGKDMLHVCVSGGYGEYMDGEGNVHLCSECAKRLILAFPLLEKVIDNSFVGGYGDWREAIERQQADIVEIENAKKEKGDGK